MVYNMTSKGQVQKLTSGQDHDLTEIGHVAYHSIRIDETNTINVERSLYLYSIKSYWRKTVGDLRWPQMKYRYSEKTTLQLVCREYLLIYSMYAILHIEYVLLSSWRFQWYLTWPWCTYFDIWPEIEVMLGQTLTKLGQVASWSTRLDKISGMVKEWRFYVPYFSSYVRNCMPGPKKWPDLRSQK